jgi:two-component system cell cycle response regulator
MTQFAPPSCVLVVDDSPVSRKLLEHALAEEPYRVVFACDGAEALHLLEIHRPALIITDWMLPDLTGPELCRAIRARQREDYAYIILLTSNTEKEQVVEGLAAGADDYLTKPFDRSELLARIGVGCRTVQLHGEIAAKNRQLEELVRTDELTGLPNRRALEEYAERQLRSAARHKFEFWLVLADLDQFKEVNDQYGRAAGDAVLRKFADVLKANTRAADFCGRWGGDEFVLAISHVEPRNVGIVLEKLRTGLAREKFEWQHWKTQISASFGIAGFPGGAAPALQELLAHAEIALRKAKQSNDPRARRNEAAQEAQLRSS